MRRDHCEGDELDEVESRLKFDLVECIIEREFLSASLAENGLGREIEERIVSYVENNKGDLDGFFKFIKEQTPAFFLERDITGRLSAEDSPFFSEVDAADRFEFLATMGSDAESELQRFSFRLPHESKVLSMNYEEFLEKQFLPARAQGVNFLDLHEAQILRWGIVNFFDRIYPAEHGNKEDEADTESTLDFLAEFLVHFSDPEQFGDEPFLDLKMSKSLQETIAFLQYLNFGEAVDDFVLASTWVAEPYMKDLRKSQDTKHPNHPDKPESATPFEHFMSVTRITLGAIESLSINSRLLGNDFNERLKARPNYLMEVAYTALLHDIVEDEDATKQEVKELLTERRLNKALVSQILENIDLLNVANSKSTEGYADSILEADNPVALLVKYADIMHNNKSSTNKKFDEAGRLSDFWTKKQAAYSRIIEAVAIKTPVHIRTKELIDVFSANPELVRFSAWKKMLQMHHKKKEIMEAMPQDAKSKVESVLAA